MNKSMDTEARALALLLHEVTRLMKRRFEAVASEHAMTLTQMRALGQITKTPGITQVALAAALDADAMTISGVLDRLDKRGLITRYPAPGDSRAKCADVTEAGRELAQLGWQIGSEVFETAIEDVTVTDREATMRCLASIRSKLSGGAADSMDGSK
jgi:DNA-binding MarR family transcriptional regulator